MIEFNIENYRSDIDSFFYKRIFSQDQVILHQDFIIDKITEKEIGESPKPSINGEVIFEVLNSFLENVHSIILGNYFICSFTQHASSKENYDVGLIIESTKKILVF